jgi:hypothetical protein
MRTLALIAIVALFSAGESRLEQIERGMFDVGMGVAPPASWVRSRRLDYLQSAERKTPLDSLVKGSYHAPNCWPAAGEAICGVADPVRHEVMLTHYGCCESNAVFLYAGAGSLGLPQRDLSGIRTASGIRIGSTSAQVIKALGSPIFRGPKPSNGRIAYGYIYYPTASKCPAYWILFVLDDQRRVVGIEDTNGC